MEKSAWLIPILGVLSACGMNVNVRPVGKARFPANPSSELPIVRIEQLPAGMTKIVEIEIGKGEFDEMRRRACAEAAKCGAEYLLIFSEEEKHGSIDERVETPTGVYVFNRDGTTTTWKTIGTRQVPAVFRLARYAGYRFIAGKVADRPAEDTQRPAKGYLGLTIKDLPPEEGAPLGLASGEGVIVLKPSKAVQQRAPDSERATSSPLWRTRKETTLGAEGAQTICPGYSQSYLEQRL